MDGSKIWPSFVQIVPFPQYITMPAKVTTKKGPKTRNIVVDCTKPVEDKIMDLAALETYLKDRIKVEGKTGERGSEWSRFSSAISGRSPLP